MIQVNTLIMLSTEEYSDQAHAGPYKVLKEFDMIGVSEIVKQLPTKIEWRSKAGPDDVITYLTEQGYIEEIQCEWIHLGSYGDINIS
jgi:hypothetical protein